jgi:hypothetical protein
MVCRYCLLFDPSSYILDFEMDEVMDRLEEIRSVFSIESTKICIDTKFQCLALAKVGIDTISTTLVDPKGKPSGLLIS